MKLTPIRQISLADLAALEEAIKAELKRRAAARLAIPEDQLVIRDVMPKTDLDLTNEVWITPTLTANAWTKYYEIKLPDNKFIAFFGAANNAADPIATAIGLRLGPGGAAGTKGVMQLEELYADEIPVGVLDEPIIYDAGATIYVDVYAKAAGTEPLVVKGKVCEPFGVLVSK